MFQEETELSFVVILVPLSDVVTVLSAQTLTLGSAFKYLGVNPAHIYHSKWHICLSTALIHDSSYLPGGPNTCSLHSGAKMPGFWSKLIPRWRMTVMNGLGERDGWAAHSSAKPSAPSNKDAGACPTFVGGKKWLCTVAQGTVGLGGLPC